MFFFVFCYVTVKNRLQKGVCDVYYDVEFLSKSFAVGSKEKSAGTN